MSEGFEVTLPRPTAASRARARALLRRADRPCLFDRVEHAVTILYVPHKTGRWRGISNAHDRVGEAFGI